MFALLKQQRAPPRRDKVSVFGLTRSNLAIYQQEETCTTDSHLRYYRLFYFISTSREWIFYTLIFYSREISRLIEVRLFRWNSTAGEISFL